MITDIIAASIAPVAFASAAPIASVATIQRFHAMRRQLFLPVIVHI